MAGAPTDNLFFEVKHSCTGKRWLERSGDSRHALAISQQFQLPEIIGRFLDTRGITADQVEAFLDPKLTSSLPDPAHLLDMDAGVARLIQALQGQEKIAVFGDYDVDGATSSALLARYFKAVGADYQIYIPDRITEGYGPNILALEKLIKDGTKVVITVDCGTTAYEPLAFAKEKALDVVVVDHHVAEAGLPEAIAVINPNRMDEASEHGQLAAVGVTFLLAVALNRGLREAGYFKDWQEPDLMQWLDIVALGTVADMVALTGVNRALVVQGLKVMLRRKNAGLSALADVALIDEAPSTYHLGFLLGPRINAGGRVGESYLGAQLLATESAEEAFEIAQKLDAYNTERREIENQVLQEALEKAEQQKAGSVVYIAGEGWHPGVIGIVASRLKERYGLPSCVLTIEDGKATGSGRSITGRGTSGRHHYRWRRPQDGGRIFARS